MKSNASKKRRKYQGGQTLILAVLAVIIIAAAIVFLFDLQNIIRGKIKAQTAVDAAALVGAKWQMNSLNMIGELNIIKACTTIITDMPETASGKYSSNPLWGPNNNDVSCLSEASSLLSQMQVRIGFTGPLIGFGAAQQAAKNNGLNYVDEYCVELAQKYEYLSSEEGDVYYGSDVTIPALYGYSWREPYTEMIRNIMQYSDLDMPTGVAVNMNSCWVSEPLLSSDSNISNNYLSMKSIYTAINANYWCALTGLLREDFGDSKWWGNIELVMNSNSFRYESELLPLGLKYTFSGSGIYNQALDSGALYGPDDANEKIMDNSNTSSGYERPKESDLLHNNYDNEDPYLCDENGEYLYDADNNHIVYDAASYDIEITETGINKLYFINPATGNVVYPGLYTKDTDEYWAPLPRISWTVYDTEFWNPYSDADSDDWKDTWGKYLRKDFKEGYRYYGAVSCAGAIVQPKLISSKWNRLDSKSQDTENDYIGDALEFGGQSSSGGQSINQYASRLKSSEAAMRNGTISDIEVFSLAKSYGRIPVANGEYLTPCSVLMVLPVFERPLIIPVELEKPSDFTPDFKWAAFKREYLPLLGTVSNVDDMPALMAESYPEHWNAGWFSFYHNALVKLNNASWRQQGIDWLETVIDEDTEKTNEDTCNYWPSSGPGTRQAPSIPF
ncbi:MAG: hypothetical protein A2020_14570 [Lentisphaerae bacterium GWF2_45_14]|nr:MAG: hypothetical protein A2020_14570 [Lentisphaerae bacterium GWF2_45_14]